MLENRFNRLYSTLASQPEAENIDAIALNPGPTLAYLTGLGFHLMERPTVLLAAPGQIPALVMPELEINKARSSTVRIQPFTYNDNPASWSRAFHEAVEALGLNGKRIGVEPNRMRVLELRFLETAAPEARIVSAENALSALRMQKDAQEVEFMRRAVRIAQQGLQSTLSTIREGVTERQIASELFINLLRAGSDPELPFQPIVSGGPNSADPHASPSDRALRRGDLLVIDWGAAYKGYISDLTRTFGIGEVEPEFEHIHQVVQMANAAGRAAGKPGVTAGSIDAAARKVIAAAGYGAQFFHRVGHGIGMEGHEPPYMYGENALVMAQGMAYTIEPGIYLSGRGGVRIEDNVVITETGAEVLSDFPRELMILGD